MLRVKRVLIPTDFSAAARPAMARGADLALQFKAEVHFLHVVMMVEPALYPSFALPPDTTEAREELSRAAKRQLEELAEALEVPAERRVIEVRHSTAIAPAILDYAEEAKVDLIAMGTHGRRGVRRFLMGSVTEEVVRKATCPVVTLRPDSGEQVRPKRIVAALDLSTHSMTVIEHARELAELYHAGVDFVHVLPLPRYPASYQLGESADLYLEGPEAERRVRGAMVEMVHQSGPDGQFEYHVVRGDPSEEILRLVERVDGDLVVVASHGMTGLTHVLMGSVADKVVRQAECPVLTVHAFGRGWVRETAA